MAYLVLARSSHFGSRLTSWSADSIEKRTAIGRRRVKDALAGLVAAGLIVQKKAGTRPQYYLPTAAEFERMYAPGAELSPVQRALFDRVRGTKGPISLTEDEATIAEDLELRGQQLAPGRRHVPQVPPGPTAGGALPYVAEFAQDRHRRRIGIVPESTWVGRAGAQGLKVATPDRGGGFGRHLGQLLDSVPFQGRKGLAGRRRVPLVEGLIAGDSLGHVVDRLDHLRGRGVEQPRRLGCDS